MGAVKVRQHPRVLNGADDPLVQEIRYRREVELG